MTISEEKMKADFRNRQVKIGWQTAEGVVAGIGYITLLAGVPPHHQGVGIPRRDRAQWWLRGSAI